MLKTLLHKVVAGQSLTRAEAADAVREIMSGEADTALMSAFLVALRMKGESVDELVGAVDALRSHCTTVDLGTRDAIDTCGTGGDGLATLNISTAAAFVVAGAGLHVAKHGNRAVSSKSGSADVLEALGARIQVPQEVIEEAFEKAGFAFLFAPQHHAAARHVAPVRRSLGLRTIFNLMGPLANPASVKFQVVGVFSRAWVRPVAEALVQLGAARAAVVHSLDGMDEVSPAAPTEMALWDGKEISIQLIEPESLGFGACDASELSGADAPYNASVLLDTLRGGGPAAFRSALALNAGLCLLVGEHAETLEDGISKAWESLRTGAALNALETFVKVTGEDPSKPAA